MRSCYKDLAGSVGYIKLFENNGKVQMLVTGLSEKDRNAAAKFLANSNLKIINSKEFVVNSNSGSVPRYYEKKNHSVSNVSVSKNVSFSNVSAPLNVSENVSVLNVSKPKPVIGPYEPLEMPKPKGFFSRLWSWFTSLFS